ncbi:copper chaperone CopZ [Anaerosporobacter sp.]
MEKTILKVDGMSCEHCVKAVNNAVGALPGIETVSVELSEGLVEVTYNPEIASIDKIKFEIEDQGYDIVD